MQKPHSQSVICMWQTTRTHTRTHTHRGLHAFTRTRIGNEAQERLLLQFPYPAVTHPLLFLSRPPSCCLSLSISLFVSLCFSLLLPPLSLTLKWLLPFAFFSAAPPRTSLSTLIAATVSPAHPPSLCMLSSACVCVCL